MRKLSPAVRLLLLLVIGLIPLTGCSKRDDTWERIEQSGVLRVGIDPTYPPFALADDAGLRGIDVDFAQALAEELGLEAQFTYFGYDGLYDALTTGQVDVLISALVILPEKTKDIAYSIPYFDAGLVLIAPTSGSPVARIANLDGKILAVELGSIGHVTALELQRNKGRFEIRTYGGVSEALAAVGAGEAHAALVDSISGRLYLREMKSQGDLSLAIVGNPVTSEPFAIATRIDDRILKAKLNEAISRLIAAGKLTTIIEHHLD